jgi:FkbM family methyltransferase
MRALVRETRRSPNGVLRRGLSALRKARLLAGDPAIISAVGGREMLLPLSHDLPVFQARHREYSLNLGRVAAALDGTQGGAPIVDIGANVGDSAAIIRQQVPAAPILCIEGDEHFLPFLRRNVRDLPGVEVASVYVRHAPQGREVELAVVRSRGTAQLVDQTGSSGSGSVATESLESILADHPRFLRPRLIKLDTDGHDADILLEAAAVLAASQPLVFFEFDPPMAARAGGTDPYAALELLVRLGYCRALFFTNTGDLAGVLDAAEWSSEVPALTAEAGPGRPVAYFDVCAFGPDDGRLADHIERRERTRP